MKSRSLLVDTSLGTWDGNPYRWCARRAALVFTSQDQWNDLKMVNAADGAHLTTIGSLHAYAGAQRRRHPPLCDAEL